MKEFRVTPCAARKILRARDHIPGSLLYANGVNGEDLSTLTEEILVKEFRMTPFAARKVLRARHFGLGCDK